MQKKIGEHIHKELHFQPFQGRQHTQHPDEVESC